MQKELIIKNQLSKQNIKLALSETLIFTAISIISFFTPIILQHPQILIGIIINMMLLRGAISLQKNKLLALCIFPSLGVLASGILFENLTNFIIYLIPFIWISNYILTSIFKKGLNKNYFEALLVSAIAKTSILFLITFILFKWSVIPKIFLSTMGYIQLITALMAGIIIFFELKIEKYINKS